MTWVLGLEHVCRARGSLWLAPGQVAGACCGYRVVAVGGPWQLVAHGRGTRQVWLLPLS